MTRNKFIIAVISNYLKYPKDNDYYRKVQDIITEAYDVISENTEIINKVWGDNEY